MYYKNINEGMFCSELIPIDLDNKEDYYRMVYSIYSSLTSEIVIDFINSNRINLFIMESAQVLANSIRLFELGYFDAAYYSMRTSIEVFTVLFDVYDYDDEKIMKNMGKFVKNEYFVRRKQIIDYLSKNGIVFADIKEKMPNFLKEMEDTSQKLNNRVHKSNFDNFYIKHKIKCQNENYRANQANEFISLLEKSIKIVAVMRLILDPIPLLMDDEEIAYRIPNLMTYSFSKDLLELIGEKTLLEFKSTEKFIGFKEWIMGFEKRNEYVDAVVMYEFIDLNNLDEIYKQKELLSKYDLMNVNIAGCSNKIIEIISYNGFDRYRTSSNNFNGVICNPLRYDQLKNLVEYFNLEYDEIFVSILNRNPNFDSLQTIDLIYIFHNEKFTQEEIDNLVSVDLVVD
ncbi:hypothetical protein [uncultured Methanobrevibacter sp.]|uniref:hypothetical protein n=1 Tax=uncultured Methanobrevibacter sp. TaxID=253161 RepID=UPI0025E106A1|nr:hypothetical protein [uncultured Methanobrevibacter sp.]